MKQVCICIFVCYRKIIFLGHKLIKKFLCCIVKEKNLSLDQYLAGTTSEDNASFSDIMRQNEEQHRLKHAWLYENETTRRQVCSPLIPLTNRNVIVLNICEKKGSLFLVRLQPHGFRYGFDALSGWAQIS